MIRTLACTPDQKICVGTPLEQLKLEDYAWVWVDFNQPTKEESNLLDTRFNFHPLAIEDCLNTLQRPKIDYYGDLQFFVLHAIDIETLKGSEVNVFMERNYVMSYHHQELTALDTAWEKVAQHGHEGELWSYGSIAITHMIMDTLVDQYFPAFFTMEDELANREKRDRDECVEKIMHQVFAMRRRLLTLWRTVVPMRDLLYRVVGSDHMQRHSDKHTLYFTDIYDHLLKLTDMLEANREMTADLRDSYISLNSNRMNSIMKTHTVVTTVFMPLTLIAGIYGMNFETMPELKWDHGYILVWGVMIF